MKNRQLPPEIIKTDTVTSKWPLTKIQNVLKSYLSYQNACRSSPRNSNALFQTKNLLF